MEAFEPLINLFTVLTVLSIAAERTSNLIKLRNADLAVQKDDKEAEKQRERQITARTVGVGVFIALLVKANFFEILLRLDSPWTTLGWIRAQSGEWVRTGAVDGGTPTIMYAIVGCIVTGVALGFGSKFWHDMLDMVYQMREGAKKKAEG